MNNGICGACIHVGGSVCPANCVLFELFPPSSQGIRHFYRILKRYQYSYLVEEIKIFETPAQRREFIAMLNYELAQIVANPSGGSRANADELRNQIQQRNTQIQQRNIQIQQRNIQIQQRDTQIQQLNTQIHQLNNQIQELTMNNQIQELTMNNQIQQLNTQIHQQLNNQIPELNNQIQQLNNTNQQLNNTNQELQQQLQVSVNRVNALEPAVDQSAQRFATLGHHAQGWSDNFQAWSEELLELLDG